MRRYVCECDHPASSQVKIGALFILLGPVILTKKQQRKSHSGGGEWSREEGELEGEGEDCSVEQQERHGRNYWQQALTCVTLFHLHTTYMPQISTAYPDKMGVAQLSLVKPAGLYQHFFVFVLNS